MDKFKYRNEPVEITNTISRKTQVISAANRNLPKLSIEIAYIFVQQNIKLIATYAFNEIAHLLKMIYANWIKTRSNS